ncbi:hypothetical protein IT397_02940 [Candidatus Nomurabacteria bacterium]|nr:hypothetical protein [Candidatus Nomurabacteria bacterium]
MRNIVYLLGTDGSGKTTLSTSLLHYYHSQKIRVTYFYGRHFPFLLQPFKILGRITALKKTNEFMNYDGYINKKHTFFTNHRIIAAFYGAIWVADYLIITLLRLFPKLFNTDMIIIDRFFLDTTVNISESINLGNDQMLKLAKFLGWFLPSSSLNIFIKVSPEIAFSRKNDIQSIRYLEERNRRYEILSNYYNFKVINGEENQENVLGKAKELIRQLINLQ